MEPIIIYNSKLKAEIDFLKFLIQNVIESLPRNKDWLNPEIEKAMRDAIKIGDLK